VPGEARELCHSTEGFGILNATPALTDHCLPALFHARGYENVAIHGFVGQMFYRDAWYPKLGFDESWFGPDLHKLGLPDCPGAFPGTCDTAIAGWISTAFLGERADKPRFIYWVTLNSHLPEPSHPDLPDDGVCATQPALRGSAALCSWFRLVRAVHQSVEQAALAPNARPTVFVLVGDHAPPFSDPDLRAEFSNTEVPFVMLTPVGSSAH
jgi:phosphoglycerol transferase MdoB-like AlkP superfamily enzyme